MVARSGRSQTNGREESDITKKPKGKNGQKPESGHIRENRRLDRKAEPESGKIRRNSRAERPRY